MRRSTKESGKSLPSGTAKKDSKFGGFLSSLRRSTQSTSNDPRQETTTTRPATSSHNVVKSPSRNRIEGVMEDIRFRESASREQVDGLLIPEASELQGHSSTENLASASLQTQPVDFAGTPKRSQKSTKPKKTANKLSTNSDDSSHWFDAISQHNWPVLEQLLSTFDHKKYRRPSTTSAKATKQKQLRVMKYLPRKNSKADSTNDGTLTSPLLEVDSMGRTPLHLACKEYLPPKMLQSLFFLERSAATITDNDGRVPLHLALLSNHNQKVLDHLIRAHPPGLVLSDGLGRTPLAYSIIRAEYARDKSIVGRWAKPTTSSQREWQDKQTTNWQIVKYMVEMLKTRRKLLSPTSDNSVLVDAVTYLAPPVVLDTLLSLSDGLLQQDDAMAIQLFQLLFQLQYPIPIFLKALSLCTLPESALIGCMCQGMVEHFEAGCVGSFREEYNRDMSFVTELLQAYKAVQTGTNTPISAACLEWWDKLRFFIGYASSCSLNGHVVDESYILHSALTIAESPPALIEFLAHLFPMARFEMDPETDALPIHVACQFWTVPKNAPPGAILELLLLGDVSLLRERHRGRIPLHLAIGRQPSSFLQAMVALDTTTARVQDPVTELYPFQLAALDSTPHERDELEQLESIFTLLFADPSLVHPRLGKRNV